MARPRKPANAGLPPYVYVKNSAFILRRPGEGTVRLCSRHAPRSEVWRRYEEHQAATGNRRTVRALVTLDVHIGRQAGVGGFAWSRHASS